MQGNLVSAIDDDARRSPRRPARARSRRGISLLWVAMMLMMFLGFLGLACDTGYVYLVAHQLQNAADAAALAGAERIKFSQGLVRPAAVNCAAANEAAAASVQLELNEDNDPNGDIVIGRYDRETRTFTVTLDAANAVQVTARRTDASLGGPVGLFFGPLFGVDTANVYKTAIAINEGGTGAGIIALCDDCECGIQFNGTVDLNVENSAVQVNSSNECAMCGSGSFTINTPAVNMVGEECINGNSNTITGGIFPEQPMIPDPLAYLPEPTYDALTEPDLGAIQSAGTYLPGYYSGGIRLTGGEVTLSPGIYMLDGDGLQIGGNTIFTANYCMCYVMGTGYVDIDGTGSITMSPPDPDEMFYPGAGTWEGVTIFQARGNTNPSRIIGTGLLDLTGSLYFPDAFLEIGGTGDGFGNQLIAWQLWIHGTGEITLAYDGDDPAPGDIIYLVE